MKNIKKQDEPGFVAVFNDTNPYDGVSHRQHWDKFRSESEYQAEVVDRLLVDQHYLCAYCEIDIYRRDGVGGIQDIGVEHFHPKSSFANNIPWVTKWSNLFAVCLGGSNGAVHEPEVRYGAPDLTCDKKKENKILDGLILFPLDIPLAPCLFTVSRTTGQLGVNEAACAESGVAVDLVDRTIVELNLNSGRLKKARVDTLKIISDALIAQVKVGKSAGEARQIVAQARLSPEDGRYFRFFTAARAYLGM
ncbi:retron system putative HNH endonuclease [Pseudomonas retamae]|uniref:Retron system putative HNH endonuclease n=1 Tax=Pseudomonas retamae TaxID=702110 RepID=A0ABW7DCZ5_9PSED